jgi:hypothetical protein
MPQVTHYQHPNFSDGYHACGMGNRNVIKITADIEQVTCQRCLSTVIGRRSNRQIDDEPKVEKKIRLNAKLNRRLIAAAEQSGSSQIDIIEAALHAHLPQQ